VKSRRREMVSKFAALSWEELLQTEGIGFKKAKWLVEMFAIAAKDSPL